MVEQHLTDFDDEAQTCNHTIYHDLHMFSLSLYFGFSQQAVSCKICATILYVNQCGSGKETMESGSHTRPLTVCYSTQLLPQENPQSLCLWAQAEPTKLT